VLAVVEDSPREWPHGWKTLAPGIEECEQRYLVPERDELLGDFKGDDASE
jgi:hypothetical protein